MLSFRACRVGLRAACRLLQQLFLQIGVERADRKADQTACKEGQDARDGRECARVDQHELQDRKEGEDQPVETERTRANGEAADDCEECGQHTDRADEVALLNERGDECEGNEGQLGAAVDGKARAFGALLQLADALEGDGEGENGGKGEENPFASFNIVAVFVHRQAGEADQRGFIQKARLAEQICGFFVPCTVEAEMGDRHVDRHADA